MIRQYALSNFKAFGQAATLPIKPITLIYGQNSSGKSSIIQSFLLLKQTLEDSENRDILLSPKGRFVDLGGFREFIFAHDLRRAFQISVTQLVSPEADNIPEWIKESLRTAEEEETTLSISFRYIEGQANAVIEKIEFSMGCAEAPLVTYVPTPADTLRDRIRFGYGAMPDALEKNVLKLSEINLSHPVWERFWNKQKQHVAKILPDLRRQIDFFKRRISRMQELSSQEQDENGDTKP